MCHTPVRRRKRDLTFQSAETYRQRAVAGYGRQPRSYLRTALCLEYGQAIAQGLAFSMRHNAFVAVPGPRSLTCGI